MVCRAAHLQPQTSSPVLRGQTPDNPQLGLRTTRRRIGWRNGTKNRDDDASLPCCVAAKYAPIAADSTVRVGARRGQRQYASSPRALPITATIKTLIYPYFSDLNRFPLRALRLLGGGKEIGNRLFWGSFCSFCFSIGYRRAGVLVFPQLLIYFLHSAAPQAHTHTRLMGHLPALLDLGNGTASTDISSLPLSFQTFAISAPRQCGVWPRFFCILSLACCSR
jgi:hypothetical protein